MDSSKIIGGGASGMGLGAAAVYIAGRFGAHLNPEDGALIASAAIGLGAFIVHNGLRGCARILWHGSSSAPTPPSA